MSKIHDWNRLLQQALRGLVPDQGMVARRNRRQSVRHALRMISRALDEEFPNIKSASGKEPKRRKRRSVAEQRRQLLRDGWVIAHGRDVLGVVAELKLPLKRTRELPYEGHGSEHYEAASWIPAWVAHYYPSRTQLSLARKNVKMIQAGDAAVRLGSLQDKILKGEISCPKH